MSSSLKFLWQVSTFFLLRILTREESFSYPLMGVNQTESQLRPSVGFSRENPFICYQGFDCDIVVFGSVNLTVENQDAIFSVWLGTKGLVRAKGCPEKVPLTCFLSLVIFGLSFVLPL